MAQEVLLGNLVGRGAGSKPATFTVGQSWLHSSNEEALYHSSPGSHLFIHSFIQTLAGTGLEQGPELTIQR